jgi:DNA-binding LacI/PurR family transcriptional regulator
MGRTVTGKHKYGHVAEAIAERVRRGEYSVAAPLPPMRQLMSDFGCSLATLTKALELLEADSVVTRLHGRGVFVVGAAAPDPAGGAARSGVSYHRPAQDAAAIRGLRVGVLSTTTRAALAGDMWWARIVRGAEAELTRQGALAHSLRVLAAERSAPDALAESLASQGLNSVLILGTIWPDAVATRVSLALQRQRLPAVLLWDGYVAPTPFSSVHADDRRGIVEACAHLASLGHRRLLFVGYQTADNWAQQRRRVFTEVASAVNGAPGTECLVPLVNPRRLPDDFAEILRRHTGVVAANDDLAVAVLQHAARHGLTAPRDFSLVGFDDDIQYREFELTTLHVDLEELGARAIRLLGGLASGVYGDDAVHIHAPPQLFVRRTTGPVPAERAE